MTHPSAYKLQEWREKPVVFVREVFGVEPDPWQHEALEAFPNIRRLGFKACKGPGKTACLAWLAWNFISTRPNPKMAATSISADNLADNLWPEMAKWQAKSEWLTKEFDWTKTRITYGKAPENWFMSARAWPRGADATKQADTLAGLHAEYLLYLLDEAGGIPDAVMAAAEAGLATGIETKIVMAGNPTNLDGPLYRACTTERHLWKMIEITGDPDNPKRSSRVSVEWAREQIQKYGRDNPWVLVNVFGEFPPSSLNVLLGPEDVRRAMERTYNEPQYIYQQKRLGVDVARFGDDMTVIFPRQGVASWAPVEMRNAINPDIAARVMRAKADWSPENIFVDGTGGFGGGVVDCLKQAGITAHEIHANGKSIDARYYNKRAEMWFEMSEWVKKSGALPNIPELVRELTTPTYTFHNGKFLIEPKDMLKKRLGYSPDRADALALTFALPEMPATVTVPYDRHVEKMKVEYDPLSSI